MQRKPTILVFEGADGAGKTSALKSFLKFAKYRRLPVKTLDFGKTNATGEKFKIASPNELQTYLTLIQHLDPNFIYVQDRGILSNIVYDGYNSLQSEALSMARNVVDMKIMVFDRDHIDKDFEDDLLKVSKERFNQIIDLYRRNASAWNFHTIKLHPTFENASERLDRFFLDILYYDT